MKTEQQTELRLQVTVRQTVTVLPRCLQILSRRGFIVTGLTTISHADGTATLSLTTVGAARWHDAVPQLLMRLVDVVDVTREASHV